MESKECLHEVVPSSSDSVLCVAEHNNETIVYARAKHSFKGRNNDELSFRKGDVITVTQQLEGGWWEGTLLTNTGWFPSNYVVVIPENERFLRSRSGGPSVPNGHSVVTTKNTTPAFSNDTSRHAYRQQVVKSFLDAELRYVDTITDFYNAILLKIKSSKQIGDEEFRILTGNLQLLVVQQREVLDSIKEAVEKDSSNARIGGLLLRAAPTLRQLLRFYCENHPKAIDLLLRNKSRFEEILSQCDSQLKDLISGLSRPFRHLETYPSTLNELERGMNESHPDRGDTQRAAAVFRDIANYCALARKQKEMQLELTTSGSISGLSSSELLELGDITYMGIVSIDDVKASTDEGLCCDRCVILLPSTLLILEVTTNVNSYILKKRIELDGLQLKKADNKLSLHLCHADGSLAVALNLLSSDELQRWIESFALCEKLDIDDSCCSHMSPTALQRFQVTTVHSMAEISPLCKAEISELPAAVKADNAKRNAVLSGIRFDHELEMVLPDGIDENENAKAAGLSSKHVRMYSGYCLRPYPAIRSNYAVNYSRKTNVRLRKEVTQSDQEDAFLLRIVEGYCSSSYPNRRFGGGRNASMGHDCDPPPQLIVAENEKMFVEEMNGDEVVVREKSLVDTVYALKDQLIDIQKEIRQLSKTVDREQKARRRLEEMVRRLNSQQHRSTTSTPKPARDSTSADSSTLQ